MVIDVTYLMLMILNSMRKTTNKASYFNGKYHGVKFLLEKKVLLSNIPQIFNQILL